MKEEQRTFVVVNIDDLNPRVWRGRVVKGGMGANFCSMKVCA